MEYPSPSQLQYKVMWSREDQIFLTTCRELPYLSAFGDTPFESVKTAITVAEMYIKDMKESNEALPHICSHVRSSHKTQG